MTDRRSGPPLFDLMRDRGERPDAPAPQDQSGTNQPAPPTSPTSPPKESTALPVEPKAPAQREPTPQPQTSTARQTAWDSTGGVSRAERSAAAMLDEPVPTESGILLSVPKFYTVIAIALVLIVAAWAGGYQIGKRDGKDEMSRFVPDQPVVSPATNSTGNLTENDPVRQPETQTNSGGSSDSATNDPGSSGQPNETANQPQGTQTQPSASTPSAVMTAEGYRVQDPRVVGMNYLVLATLPTEQAADAIAFMDTNGVTIIGVPQLDSRGSSANNPSRYTLYSLGLAIPGNRWSAMSSQRLEHQNQIASLGARWQRERRGGSDFSQTNWEKYEP